MTTEAQDTLPGGLSRAEANRIIKRRSLGAWHRHEDLRCTNCEVLMFLRVTCASREPATACVIPDILVCAECQRGEPVLK